MKVRYFLFWWNKFSCKKNCLLLEKVFCEIFVLVITFFLFFQKILLKKVFFGKKFLANKSFFCCHNYQYYHNCHYYNYRHYYCIGRKKGRLYTLFLILRSLFHKPLVTNQRTDQPTNQRTTKLPELPFSSNNNTSCSGNAIT